MLLIKKLLFDMLMANIRINLRLLILMVRITLLKRLMSKLNLKLNMFINNLRLILILRKKLLLKNNLSLLRILILLRKKMLLKDSLSLLLILIPLRKKLLLKDSLSLLLTLTARRGLLRQLFMGRLKTRSIKTSTLLKLTRIMNTLTNKVRRSKSEGGVTSHQKKIRKMKSRKLKKGMLCRMMALLFKLIQMEMTTLMKLESKNNEKFIYIIII